MGVGLHVLEERHAAQLLPRRLAGLHRVQQVAPVLPPQRVTEEQRHVAHGSVGPQCLADGREGELAVGTVAKHAPRRQRAHQPVHRIGVRADPARHLIGRKRAVANWSGMPSLTAT
jgi:hypothetical protein